ncbi:hypothetical protein PMAYCL1PPCAC_07066, partial [Pristionchus mayeri]
PSTTTTAPFLCCPILTSSSLLKVPPVVTGTGLTLEQCSVLRRISSDCGDEAYLTCSAAEFTNPNNVFIQIFNINNVRIGEIPGNAQMASATLTCNHLTGQYIYNGGVVARVSCAQSGSKGADGPDQIFP